MTLRSVLRMGALTIALLVPAAVASAQAITSESAGQPKAPRFWRATFASVFQPGARGEAQGDPVISNTLTLRASTYGGWFAETAFYRHSGAAPAAWRPDFTYQAGYTNWRPGSLSVTFGSGVNNHFTPNVSAGERTWTAEQGTFMASYRVPFRRSNPWGIVRWTDMVDLRAIYRATPRYSQAGSRINGRWKQTLSASAAYTFGRAWFAQAEVIRYLNPASQQPWDPTVTWSAGYRPWQPRTFTLVVQNYSGRLRATQLSVGYQW